MAVIRKRVAQVEIMSVDEETEMARRSRELQQKAIKARGALVAPIVPPRDDARTLVAP
jgi:hypothetical protein